MLKTRPVLFTGTPCQVYALNKTIENNENLYTIDLVCHGVPAPKLFNGYREYLEKKKRGKIQSYCFRSKEHANATMSYTVMATYRDEKNKLKKFFIDGDEEPYTMRFISNALQCKACYQCPFTCLDRQGDITLGDYWGYQKEHPDYASVQCVSLVLVNTKKGQDLIKDIQKSLVILKTEEKKFLPHNGHLTNPPVENPERNMIYSAFADMGFSKTFYKKYFVPKGYRTFILKRRMLRILHHIGIDR